jgi:hypothetical protein
MKLGRKETQGTAQKGLCSLALEKGNKTRQLARNQTRSTEREERPGSFPSSIS